MVEQKKNRRKECLFLSVLLKDGRFACGKSRYVVSFTIRRTKSLHFMRAARKQKAAAGRTRLLQFQ